MSRVFVEIIYDILLKVRVKTLLRLRCVSKSLCNLIDSPEFIKAYLSSSIQAKPCKKLILCHYKSDNPDDFYVKDYSSGSEVTVKISLPIVSASYSIRILGSSNGLILLMHNYRKLLIWNPFINQYKILPGFHSIFPDRVLEYDAIGFGFDPASDDYKVVRIPTVQESGVAVYSLRSNSWRKLEDFSYWNYKLNWIAKGMLVDGALHWLFADETTSKLIVVFDISTEKFHTVEVPNQPIENTYSKLHALGDRLYFSSKSSNKEFYLFVGERDDAGQMNWIQLDSVPCKRTELHSGFLDLKEADKVLLDIELGGGCHRSCNDDATTCWESPVSVGYVRRKQIIPVLRE